MISDATQSTPAIDSRLASLRRELWRMDWWLEDRFDFIVKHGQGPDTAAKLAELHEHALQRSHGG